MQKIFRKLAWFRVTDDICDSRVVSVICDLRVASFINDSWIVKLLDTRFNKERGERKKRKERKTLEAHQNSYNDTTGTVRKILTRWIQQYQERSSTVIGVGQTSSLKASEPRHLWTVRVIHSIHRLWSSLVFLDLSCWDFLIVLVVSSSGFRCASELSFFFLFSLFSLFINYEERGERIIKKNKKITLEAH